MHQIERRPAFFRHAPLARHFLPIAGSKFRKERIALWPQRHLRQTQIRCQCQRLRINLLAAHHNDFRRVRTNRQSSLHIELVDWEDGRGWETPAMYETRRQNERRAEAVSLMQADSAVQKLQQLFSARWMESSIRLLSDSAS